MPQPVDDERVASRFGDSHEAVADQDVGPREVRTGTRFRYVGLIAFLLIVFGAPAALFRFDSEPSFDQASLDRLNSVQPEFVFLGNSLLETRIDPNRLNELLNDRAAVSLAVEGSQSAVWYLQLKSLVAASDSPPDTVFVFFHNDLITKPQEALDGRNSDLIESLVTGDGAEFEEILDSSRTAHQKTVATLQQVYPLQEHGTAARDGLSEAAAALFPSSRSELSSRADDAFAFQHRREPEVTDELPEASKPFQEAVSNSFLPTMLQVAEEAGIRLVFVRVQARPNEDGSPNQSESMRFYAQDLGYYLKANGADYVDFTGNPAVDAALYYDSFHIRQRYLLDYTELFFREMAEYFDVERQQ